MRGVGFGLFGDTMGAVRWLVLGITVALSGPAAAADVASASKPAATGPPKLAASGKVVDKDGRAVSNAKVVLREWSNYRRGEDPFAAVEDVLATTSTDGQGGFSFSDVPSRPFRKDWPESAPWDAVVQADGYALAWQHLGGPSESSPVTLTLVPEAEITGQVVDSQQIPVVGARVSAEEVAPLGSPMRSDVAQPNRLDLGMSQMAPAVQTDAQGRFQIRGLPSSMRITLVVRHDDFVRQPVFVATTDQPQANLTSDFVADGKQRSVSYPVHTGKVEVKLQPGCRFSGRVTYADSAKPCTQAHIGLTGSSWYPAVSDADGRFTIPGLPPEQYTLLAYPPEEASYLVRQVVVTLAPGQRSKQLAIGLERGQIVTGKVIADDTRAGVEAAEVYYRASVPQNATERSLARAGVTDSQGAFRVIAPPGDAELVLSGPVAGYYVPEWRLSPQEPDPHFVQQISVEPGKPREGVEFTVARGLVVGGVVTDAQGKAVADADVISIRDNPETASQSPSTKTDQDGRFRLSGLPPAEPCQLFVVHPQRKLIGGSKVDAQRTDAATRTVSVTVQLQPAASASGLVLHSGKPLAGVQVTLLSFRTEKEHRYAMASDYTTTDPKGQYEFDLLEPGEQYAALVNTPGYSQEQTDPFKPKAGQRVELTPLEPMRADRSISGTVVDREGKPLAGATVSAMRQDGRWIGGAFTREPTGPDGRFKIEGVPNAPFLLVAYVSPQGTPPRGGATSAPVDVTPDKTDVRIILDATDQPSPKGGGDQ